MNHIFFTNTVNMKQYLLWYSRMNELPAWSKKPGQNVMKAGVFRLDSESESDDDNDEQVLLDRAFYLSGGNKKRMM